MGSQVYLDKEIVSDMGVSGGGDAGSSLEGSDNLGDDILEGLESIMQDINDRLTVSRMVSDSIIKGIVTAVEKDAAESIARKELEMKESLQFHEVVNGTIELALPEEKYRSENVNYGQNLSFNDVCVRHDEMRKSLAGMRNVVSDQFKKLKKEINNLRGCSPIRKINSSSDLVGLSGILKERVLESWVGVEGTLDAVRMTMDDVCTWVDEMLLMSKTSLCEWQQEQEFQGELESMVMQNLISSIQEDFEEKMWEQNARLCGCQSLNWAEKFNEILNLRKDLGAILKSVSDHEAGHLISHGSSDLEYFHRQSLKNNESSSTFLWEENGQLEKSKNEVPENFDPSQLRHMKHDELVNYFNNMITTLKRKHESVEYNMTEKYFSLKREYLKLKDEGYSMPHKRDKDFDILKDKIPGVVLKLDHILLENEKSPALMDNAESLGNLKNRVESLIHENRQLRDSLTDQKHEVKYLSLQLSDAIQEKSRTEAKFLKLIESLNSASEDAQIEASLVKEVNKCVIGELSDRITCLIEESDLEFSLTQEIYGIIFNEAGHNAENNSNCDNDDSDFESLIEQVLRGAIFEEIMHDAEKKLKDLYAAYVLESEHLTSLKIKLLEKECKLRSEIEEKEKLIQEISSLLTSMEEKEKLAVEASAALARERVDSEFVSKELGQLREYASQQKKLISKNSKELDSVKGNLMEAFEQIEQDKMEICQLGEQLQLAMKKLEEADEEKTTLLALNQERENSLLLVDRKEKEHRKQIEAIVVTVHELLKALAEFDSKVSKDFKENYLRLEHTESEISSLIKKANLLKTTGFVYQQRLERRCTDLQMAEAEVDLLGDEVDALLSLLEKIYIALDHYSPVLWHYPGIIEILKLIKRELGGGSTKLA